MYFFEIFAYNSSEEIATLLSPNNFINFTAKYIPIMAKKKVNKTRKTKKKENSKTKKHIGYRLFKYIFSGILFMATLLAIFVVTVYYGAFGKIPDYRDLKEIRHYEASSLYSADGELLGKYYIENRTTVPFHQIAQHAIDALIATEDVRFFEHKGFDKISMLRVIFKTLLLGDKSAGGGSTISQQLAKNLFPRENPTRWRMPIIKIKEMVTAHRLERLYSKPEILTLYLNTVSFGEDVFGIESAAQKYFSTSATRLTIPQAATLIGLLKGPSYYNPRLHPDRALQRRNTVIGQMVKYDYLDDANGERLMKKELELKYTPLNHYSGLAPYMREQIRQDAQQILNQHAQETGRKYDLYKDGLLITTTLDAEMQRYAEKAVIKHMSALQQSFNTQWGNTDPWENDKQILTNAIKQSQTYKQLKQSGKAEKEILSEMGKKKQMLIYDPVYGEVTRELSSIDSVKHYLRLLHPGVIAVEPRTGKVKVWVGGQNFKYFQYDQVKASRQVGSVFKPVVYSAAIHQGAQIDFYYENKQRNYPAYNNWSPKNSDNQYGGFYTLRGALSKSINTIAVQVLLQTGIPETIKHARELGINSELPSVPSLALGTANIPLEEMIHPYLCYANQGKWIEPYCISEIRDTEGYVIYKAPEIKAEQVIPANEAYLISSMLTDVINEGTGGRLRSVYSIHSALAGKTGTTQNQADGWFIGYNPDIVVGVRVGANNAQIHFKTTALGQGANTALPIFGIFMQQCLASNRFTHWNNSRFPQPVIYRAEELNAPPYLEKLSRQEENSRKKLEKIETKENRKTQEKTKRGLFRRIFKKKDRTTD